MERDSPPLRPTALTGFKQIDAELSQIVARFWKRVWGTPGPAFEPRIKYLLSLANAVGAGRLRQATRELIKAHAAGVSVAELDELFTLLVWNQGAGHFASEIGPSALFGAYQLIKTRTREGLEREAITEMLLRQFGEDNPEVGTRGKTP